MLGVLDRTAHRPWPLPEGPWVVAQSWHDLLFAHWRVDAALLRPHVPAALEIDTFEGQAWIAVVPFRMSGVRLRWTPALPWLSAFPELNVRTYVVAQGKPGVWFFSLDAGNPVAVALARTWFHLPYFRARMKCQDADGWIQYASERTHRDAQAGILETKYRPAGEIFEPARGTREHFLTERYCLYAADPRGRIYRSDIHHDPWQLQIAGAKFALNTMTEAAGFALPSHRPLLHFARRQDAVAWAPQRIARDERRSPHHLWNRFQRSRKTPSAVRRLRIALDGCTAMDRSSSRDTPHGRRAPDQGRIAGGDGSLVTRRE